MPRLNNDIAQSVATAEASSGSYEPLAPGKYIARLSGVETRTSANGNEYWSWEFSSIHDMDGNKKPGRQWYITMLPGGTRPAHQDQDKWNNTQNMYMGRLRHLFENVFGYSTDTDTEELIGEVAILTLGVETVQSGQRQGQKTNRVNSVDKPTEAQIAVLEDTGF